MLIDAGYGNNTTFLLELEKRRLKYLGGLAKNRKVISQIEPNKLQEIRLDELAKALPVENFTPVQLNLDRPKTVWVAPVEVELSQLEGTRTIAIVMNASTFDSSSDVDYFITNVDSKIATPDWIVTTYAQRSWWKYSIGKLSCWLGLSEYQVRDYRSLLRHFILVFCAYTFILWHSLTGGLRRRWANKPLNTFVDALEAFRTAMSFRFIEWLNHNRDVFFA